MSCIQKEEQISSDKYNNYRTIIRIPDKLMKNVTTCNKPSLEQLIKKLSKESINHIYVYVEGEIVIQNFLAAGLVNEITVTTVPTIIGKGKSFSGLLQ